MGLGNLADPNAMTGMMQTPQFQQQMASMLQNPEVLDQVRQRVLDARRPMPERWVRPRQALTRPCVSPSRSWQIIASNPQLSAMGPQIRQMMQSEQFRNFLTNPESMRQMAQMRGMMGGAGGAAPFPPVRFFVPSRAIAAER